MKVSLLTFVFASYLGTVQLCRIVFNENKTKLDINMNISTWDKKSQQKADKYHN